MLTLPVAWHRQLENKLSTGLKKQGGKVFEGLKNSVKKGKNGILNWFKNTLPKFLYDMAIQAGLEAVAEWILNNWPF